MAYKMLNRKKVWHNAGVPKPRRTKEEIIEVGTKVCKEYAKGEMTIGMCCKKFHVSMFAFASWACVETDLQALIAQDIPLPKRANLEIHLLYKEVKKATLTAYKEDLKSEARNSLKRRVTGYEKQDVLNEYEVDRNIYLVNADGDYVLDDEGQKSLNPNFGKMTLVAQKIRTYTVDPDMAAVKIALENVDSENFRDRKFIGVASSDVTTPLLDGMSDEEIERKMAETTRRLAQVKKTNIEDIDHEDVIEEE